ncbi:MAG TPA: adenylate/guanylate cyclase domain-containing protein [Jatrophihabitantaceae bacterium]
MVAARVAEQSSRALHAYVPRLAIEWLRRHPDERHLAVDGSLAFVDISGFTKLTERLARVGRAGPEELSDILDSTFGALLTAARTDGADLVKWGGDAVLLLFRGDDHATRAARAAYRMRRVLRDVGHTQASAGQVTLRMSVGIHSGRFHFFLVGDPEIHRELIVSGPGASVTAEMESIASAGQIVVSDATAALLHPASIGLRVSGGWVLRSVPVLADLTVPEVTDDDIDVRPLLPAPVRAHLLAAAGASEHRPLAVAFIQFSGTDALIGDAGAAAAVEALDECVRNVQEACATHGVSFLESDINRDGGKIMLAAGAPRSSGDDDDRLLRAVQVVIARQGRLPLRAGVNHGRVFAGDFGPAFRRTYSIKGDAINVAARVMAHAEPGAALATNEVMARSRTMFATRQFPPFMVKGKAKPIRAVLLGAPQGDRDGGASDRNDDAFVGRDTELAALREALDRTRARRGSLVEVIGEPGMGKSRLVQEVLRETADLVVVSGASGSYESKTPYYPFRTLLRQLLGVRQVDGATAIARRLADRVEVDAPHLLPWLPLLGIVLDAELPATRETDEVDERFRRARLEEVLVEFLGLVLPTPTLLVFENAQLMDDASADLLHKIGAGLGVRPWLVLVTRRDVATGYVPARTGEDYRLLPLTPIVGPLALDLLDSVTRSAPLSAHAMNAIASKAGGNPLFLRALVSAAARSGSEADLPDSVEAVLTSEVDRLEPNDRTLLRYAAVLGVRFSEPMLREMLVASGSAAVDADLGRLGGFVEHDGGGVWLFRHALMRDVAYAGLPYRLRRRMHDHAGRALEASATNLEEISERLSMHFFHAGDYERAWTYSRMAGRRAQSQYAYTAAIEFFERAIESGRASGAAHTELAEVLEALGDVCDIAGFSHDAVVAYRRARPYRRDDPVGRAALMLKEAGLHQRLSEFVTSLRLLTHARGVLRDSGGALADSIRSRLATRYGFGKYLQGAHASAVRWSEVGVREARLSGDRDALAYAYNTRHLACIHAGVGEEEAYGELALAVYEDLGDLRMQAHCLNNLAISAMHDGQWDRSADLLDRAAGIFRRVGDTANEANAQYNRADLLIRQQRFAQAEPLLVAALRAAQAADDRELVALAMRESGRVRAGLGHPDDALARFDAARAGFTELGLAQELVSLDEATAECLVEAGDVDRAIELASAALARAHELHVESALASLHRVRGSALGAAGRYADARAAFEAGLHSPDGSDGRREYALNLLGIAELAAREDHPDAARLMSEGRQILDGLGVLMPSVLVPT